MRLAAGTFVTAFLLQTAPQAAQNPVAGAPPPKAQPLPVRAVAIFKDGHTFLRREGTLPVTADGASFLGELPVPVLGTFWAYSADPAARLLSADASERTINVSRPILSIPGLLRANPGARVRITQTDHRTYDAQVEGTLGFDPPPPRAGAGLNTAGGFGPPAVYAVLLKTAEGTSVVPLSLVQSVVFKDAFKRTETVAEPQTGLSMRLDWSGRPPAKSARVGVAYVQNGIRWIPSYRLELNGKGLASVRLQCTLRNELLDLEDVAAQLVVGVPRFVFKDSPDPISLSEVFPPLSSFFEAGDGTRVTPRTAIMGQGGGGGFGGGMGGGSFPGGGMGGGRRCGPEDGGTETAGPQVEGSAGEDLFFFEVPHLTLKRGDSSLRPLADYQLPYRDVYVLDVPLAPPPELRSSQELPEELRRQLVTPRVKHRIRLTNTGPHPLTTAPALVLRDGRILTQEAVPYTPRAGEADVTLSDAPDIRVSHEEQETKRTPNAARYNLTTLAQIDLAGTLKLTSLRSTPVEVEVVRHVMGTVDSAGSGGKVEVRSAFDPRLDEAENGRSPYGSFSYPPWWQRFNPTTRIRWTVRLQPNESVELGYAWHYFAE
jgi:hypothetical protein